MIMRLRRHELSKLELADRKRNEHTRLDTRNHDRPTYTTVGRDINSIKKNRRKEKGNAYRVSPWHPKLSQER